MPKFTDSERSAILNTLLKEGERLFIAHGFKKVTIEDLAEAAGISKGSFYAFYQTKEHLFMAINFAIQERLFADIEQELIKHQSLPAKELAQYVFKLIYHMASKHPILSSLDKPMMQHLQRKLPAEIIIAHTKDDMEMVQMLGDYGIKFTEDVAIIAKTLQTILGYSNWLLDDADNERIIEILIGGVLNLIE